MAMTNVTFKEYNITYDSFKNKLTSRNSQEKKKKKKKPTDLMSLYLSLRKNHSGHRGLAMFQLRLNIFSFLISLSSNEEMNGIPLPVFTKQTYI